MTVRVRFAGILGMIFFAHAPCARAQVFQALAQREGVYNLGNYDGSQILAPSGAILSMVTITDRQLDVTRLPGESRAALFTRLYAAGMRVLFVSSQDSLWLQPFGALAPLRPQGPTVQVLEETRNGFSLDDWSTSLIVDSTGAVLAHLSVTGGQPNIVPRPAVTPAQLFDRVLRVLAVAPRRLATLERDASGAVRLRMTP